MMPNVCNLNFGMIKVGIILKFCYSLLHCDDLPKFISFKNLIINDKNITRIKIFSEVNVTVYDESAGTIHNAIKL